MSKLIFTEIVNNTKQVPLPTESASTGSTGYIRWGTDNKYPEYLWSLYLNSSMLTSIISSYVDYIIGEGIENKTTFQAACNRKGETLEEVIKKIAFDYVLFGGFSFQVILNQFNKVAEVNWIDFRKVRINEDEDTVYYNDWSGKKRKQTVTYPRFNPMAKQASSIFYFKGHITREHYPIQSYVGAIKSLEISTQIPEFHLNQIVNNFAPSVVINMNNGSGLAEDEVKEIQDKFNEKFLGTTNAGKIVLSFNDDLSHKTTIERVPEDQYDQKYQSLAESVKKDVYAAFRINPILLGLNDTNGGFNSEEFAEAFKLFNKTVISPIQKDIIDSMEKVLGKGCIEFKPFQIEWEKDNNEVDNVE